LVAGDRRGLSGGTELLETESEDEDFGGGDEGGESEDEGGESEDEGDLDLDDDDDDNDDDDDDVGLDDDVEEEGVAESAAPAPPAEQPLPAAADSGRDRAQGVADGVGQESDERPAKRPKPADDDDGGGGLA
jgi:hypothetical protein